MGKRRILSPLRLPFRHIGGFCGEFTRERPRRRKEIWRRSEGVRHIRHRRRRRNRFWTGAPENKSCPTAPPTAKTVALEVASLRRDLLV